MWGELAERASLPESGSSGRDLDRRAPSHDHARQVPYAECARRAGYILSTAVSTGLTPVSPLRCSFHFFRFLPSLSLPYPPLPLLRTSSVPSLHSLPLLTLPIFRGLPATMCFLDFLSEFLLGFLFLTFFCKFPQCLGRIYCAILLISFGRRIAGMLMPLVANCHLRSSFPRLPRSLAPLPPLPLHPPFPFSLA